MKTLLFILITCSSLAQGVDTLITNASNINVPKLEYEVIDLCDTYIEANFIGDLNEYIAKHMNIPDCDELIQLNKIYVFFVIEKNGDLSNIQVHRAPCNELKNNIIKLFDEMPLWSPGSDATNGAVRTSVVLPIRIELR